jgi:hypothetical protein
MVLDLPFIGLTFKICVNRTRMMIRSNMVKSQVDVNPKYHKDVGIDIYLILSGCCSSNRLRHYATNWKVVDSIPDEVIVKFT